MALDFLAGCAGGAVGVLVGHPFDTVKVRLQTTPSSVYRGTLHCFTSIIKQESVLGLYRGLTSPLYSLAFINAILFGVQGNLQRRLTNPDTLYSHMIAGASAGISQAIICSPMELAKTNMQIKGIGQRQRSPQGPVDFLMQVYRKNGLAGVFRGYGITVLRDASGFAVYFSSYEYLCQKLTSKSQPSPLVLMVAGGLAGVSSWIFSYPIDVIKTRMQADGGSDGKYKFSSYADCYRNCVQQGYSTMFRGFNATILRAFPVNAATFTTVSLILRYFGDDDKKNGMESIHSDHKHLSAKLAQHAEHIMLEEAAAGR